MIANRMLLSVLILVTASSVALAQTKTNSAVEQLKDVNRTSQDAAGTKKPEASKAKSNQNIDTAQPPAVRAGTPSTKTKAEREADAIKAYKTSAPAGTPQLREIAKKKPAEPPSPGSAPAKTAAPATLSNTPAPKTIAITPAKTTAAAPKPAAITTPVAPVRAAAPVAAAPARVATPVVTAPVKPSTTTYTTPSSPSASSSSSSSKK